MAENIPKKVDTVPENFDSVEEFEEFWDGRSTADYEELMEPVSFDIAIDSTKTYLPVPRHLYALLRQQARKEGVSVETLANLWLQEKLLQLTELEPA